MHKGRPVASVSITADQHLVVSGSVQSFSHFRFSVLFGKVVGLRLFCSWPRGGQEQSGQAMTTTSASRSICR